MPPELRLKWPDERVERYCVFGALGVYLVFQLHAIAFHGYWGQDFLTHKLWTIQAAEHPWQFFNYSYGGTTRTNPPLYHLLGGVIRRLLASPYRMPAIGLMNVAFGLIGLCCVYGVIRRLISSSLLRIAAMVFILFLPFAMIHAEVVASDALATPLFWVLLWLMIRFPASGSSKTFLASIVSIAVLLVAGIFVKFTFFSFLAAAAVWVGLLWRTRLISNRRLALMFLVITVVPGLLGFREAVRFRTQQEDPWAIRPSLNLLWDGWMNLRSMVWVRSADVDVLSAPTYNRTVQGKLDLLINNKHSLPGLLQLGMFTDILNIYQFDPYDHHFGMRTLRNHRRMEIAVRSGIAASLLAVIGVLVLGTVSARGVARRHSSWDLQMFTMLLCCGAWFANIVSMFPFIHGVYDSGFWLPRLIAPALIGFFVAGFALVDKTPGKKLHIAVLIFVVAQSAIHASFLWPTKAAGRLYEADADIANSQAPAILRIFNWPDQYGGSEIGGHWLDRTMGIVVNRPEGSKPENWKLSLTMTPGPAGRTTHRIVRLSSRDLAPVLVEFEWEKSIEVEVPLAAGRNDIVLEIVSPDRVPDTRGDPLVRLVQVSRIALRGPDGTRVTPHPEGAIAEAGGARAPASHLRLRALRLPPAIFLFSPPG